MPINLTSVGAGYNPSGTFGQSLNAGYAQSSVPLLTAAGNFTIAGRIKPTSLPGAVKVALGQLSGFWVGCNSANQIVATLGGDQVITYTSSITMVPGTSYYVELGYSNTTGGILFIDGVNRASSSTLLGAVAALYTNVFAIRNFGGAPGFEFPGEIDDVSFHNVQLHTAGYSVPTTAIANNAANTSNIWHLDGDLLDSFTASSAATTTTLSGPSSGVTGVASTNFTAGANGTITGTVIVTPNDSSGGGTFTPTTVSISSGAPTGTFTYTPGSTGAKTIATTNNGSLANPTSITYTSTAVSSTKYTLVDTTDTYTGQNIRILVPNSNSAIPYNAANPTKCIIYTHGVGEDHTALLADSLKAGCVDALLDAGYILAGSNANGGNFGNQASINSHAALAKYLQTNYNVSGFGIWSQSMGGLAGLLLITENKIPNLVGWLGTYPMCSLSANYGTAGGSDFTAQINSAFGITGTGNATYANLTYGFNAVLKQATAFRHLPMRFYASAGDTVVRKDSHTDILQPIIAGSCRESTVVICSGNHGDVSHFLPSDYVAFFNSCFANPVSTFGVLGGSSMVSLIPASDFDEAGVVIAGNKKLGALNQTQKNQIKTAIQADPVLNIIPPSSDGINTIIKNLNFASAPSFWVWKTSVSKKELINVPGPTGTLFNRSGNGFFLRQAGEISAWDDLFDEDGMANPSLPQVRQALTDIFSGGSTAGLNLIHLLAASRREATVLEKIFATSGTGSTSDPATIAVTGTLSYAQIRNIMGSPW